MIAAELPSVTLGRTGLVVSAAGLGCGGHSRLGQQYGATFDESVGVVQRALDLGVTLIDTARAYRTEEIVGTALKGRRDRVVVSSKSQVYSGDGSGIPAAAFRASVELSLRRLSSEWIDVFHLHGVRLSQYDYCLNELVPEMLRLRDEGKIKFLAISEAFAGDPRHEMLQRAVNDRCWDVMMVGFNLLNPTARDRVFALTRQSNVGILIMFAVRRALSRPESLRSVVADLVARGDADAGSVDLDDPLGFLVRPDEEGAARSVVEASYRFARHEPGAHVVLTGTGNLAHLEQNVRSISGPPLPTADLNRLRELFGHVDSVSGN
jgi:aryl-alcohol dehydrogenase-like predicted oxidoreductase